MKHIEIYYISPGTMTGNLSGDKMKDELEEKRKCVSINISGDNASGKTILIKKLLPFLESEGYSCIELVPDFTSEPRLKRVVRDYDIFIYETVKKEFSVSVPADKILRDYFAGQAMKLYFDQAPKSTRKAERFFISKSAYHMADAMIEARRG